MAIVYSYPLNNNIKPFDELVGTTEQSINGQSRTVTRNFQLQSLINFFSVSGLQKTLTLTTNNTSGAATLDPLTGILNIPNYSTGSLITPAALTKVDDTNVTLTLGGLPNTALLQNTSLTLGWTGTLADSRITSASVWNAKQNAITLGSTSQYLRGDLSLAVFPTNISSFTNDSGYITSATAAATYEPKIIAGTNTQYWRGDKTWQTFPTIPTVGTWGGLNYPTWTTGTPFVKMTASGTFSLDTNTYLTSVYAGNISTDGGVASSTTFLRGDNTWSTAITSLAAGNGMNFATITTTGTISLGTPSNITLTSTNNTSANSHTHAFAPGGTTSQYITGAGTIVTFPTIPSGTITSVTATSPITSTGGTTPVISTSMNTGKLIGRSTTDIGVMEEIAVGSGLNLTAGILTSTGGGGGTGVIGYYGQYFSYTTQSAITNNIGKAMVFETPDIYNGITVVTDGTALTKITFANTGKYNLQFSTQLQNLGNASHDVYIWLRKNGVTSAADVTGSTGVVGMEARKSAGDPYHTITTWNFLLDITAGDFYQIIWATTDITNVSIQFYASTTNHPSTASTLFTVTQLANIAQTLQQVTDNGATTTKTITIDGTDPDNGVLTAFNSAVSGTAIVGIANNAGVGVQGNSTYVGTDTNIGVYGFSESGNSTYSSGVSGEGEYFGVKGTGSTGVKGQGDTYGVQAISTSGVGLYSTSSTGSAILVVPGETGYGIYQSITSTSTAIPISVVKGVNNIFKVDTNGSVIANSFAKINGTQYQNLKADGSVSSNVILYKYSTVSFQVTTGTIYQSSVLIPSNIFSNGDLIKINLAFLFTPVPANVSTIRIYLNTSPVPGGILIGSYNTDIGDRYVPVDRFYWYYAGNISGRDFTASASTSTSNSIFKTDTITLPSTFYIITYVHTNGTDKACIASITIEKT